MNRQARQDLNPQITQITQIHFRTSRVFEAVSRKGYQF